MKTIGARLRNSILTTQALILWFRAAVPEIDIRSLAHERLIIAARDILLMQIND
jgi:hypothetical protein